MRQNCDKDGDASQLGRSLAQGDGLLRQLL